MSRQLTIEGRFVQGGLTMIQQKDMRTGLPKKDAEGKPVLGNFIAIAVPKKIQVNGQWIDNPKVGEYYAAFDAEARLSFPHLFPNGGACAHPRFAMKWQDGDGVDTNGKSVSGNPGFAGHWIIKCATQLRAPNCYMRNASGGLDQLTEPDKLIKKGFYVAVALTIAGNGVEPNNAQAVPGLFVTPEQVLFVAPGEEIFTGIDPNEAFSGIAGQQAPAGTAAGLSAPPQPGQHAPPAGGPPLPGNAMAASPLPGAALPASGSPPLPGGAAMQSHGMPPMPGAAVPLPPVAAGPRYIMQPTAMGASREDLLKLGWTDDGLVSAGHMVIQQ